MGYIFGGNTGETAESLARKRQMAQALAARRTPRNLGEGIGEIGNALASAAVDWRTIQDGKKLEQERLARQTAADEQYGGIVEALTGQPTAEYTPQQYRDAIASIESAGSGDYGAVGPVTPSGKRAYGRYQVMDFNIPKWTKEALGREMTPQEFLADQAAQDAVFDHRFGGYVKEYGNPQDAASMWFSGRPAAQAGNASDGYTTVPDYLKKFTKALGGPQPQQQKFDPRILAALGNRDLSEGQRQVLTALLGQQMQGPKFTQISADEAKRAGLDPTKSYQRGPDGRISQIGGNGVQVNVDQKGETKFEESIGSALGKEFVEMYKVGASAKEQLGMVADLRQLISSGVGGTGDVLRAWAKNNLGVNFGVGQEVEMFEAIINRMTPMMRQGLPGAASDRDVQMFRGALPQLANSPEGNMLILDTFEALGGNAVARADIAAQVVSGGLSRADAVKQIQELPDPFAEFRERRERALGAGEANEATTTPNDQAIERPPEIPDTKWNALTPEDRAALMRHVWPTLSAEERARWAD